MNEPNSSWSYGNSDRPRNGYQWDYYSNPRNNSAFTKMQHQYWVTKETVFRKLGKKEDENIVASDAELDAKLELFRSIQESCSELQRIIDRYQERLVLLAQEENGMGRFLKEAGKNDKTGAGNMMLAVGKTMSHSGQLRVNLRMPLIRLFQEVETFRQRAVEDTLRTVQSMEKIRTEYRASLKWMKDVSQQLDPDTFNQLDKFRKVQAQVKRSKARFDKLKLDCLQKVDLLAAARCNMFSHALITYHNTLLAFATASANAFSALSKSAKDHRKFEFTVIKELSELKIEEKERDQDTGGECHPESQLALQDTDEKLLEFEDFDSMLKPEGKPEEVAGASPSNDPESSNCGQQFLPSQLLLMDIPSLDVKEEPESEAGKETKVSWLELFSELDPLSNPDMIGRSNNEPLRDC